MLIRFIGPLLLVLAPSLARGDDAAGFDAVAPILRERCASCHGARRQKSHLRVDRRAALLAGGDSGKPSIVPGKSADSRLIHLVSGADEDLVMPPKGERLTERQVTLLRAWIDAGAKMPGSVDWKEVSPEGEAKTDHWSFRPLRTTGPPKVDHPFVRTAVDAFLFAKLADRGLTPSPGADRETLIRRLFLVMHGLAPTPAEIDEFLADERPGAYDDLVARVLGSPRYGERWARHWLDLVRFGETTGFEVNRERPNAWPYRDWVIESLNSDKPYDRFVREQIAGDAFGAPLGTGFLVGGPFDQVKSPDINLTQMQRQDELADIINTTGTTFLGLTLGCARCHDHKFDPIEQRDYYSIQAIFAGVEHGEREIPLAPASAKEAAGLLTRIGQIESDLVEFLDVGERRLIRVEDRAPPGRNARGLVTVAKPAGTARHAAGTGRGEGGDLGAGGRSPNVSDGEYTWWKNEPGRFVAAYRLHARGSYRVWLSWGAGHASHSKDAEYVLDVDGRLDTDEDQAVIATVDQQRLVGDSGKPAGRSLWSGFLDAGVHDLNPGSVVALRGGKTGAAITSDLLVLEMIDSSANVVGSKPRPPAFRAPVKAKHNVERIVPTEARFVRFTIHATNSSEPCIDELELFSGTKNVALASSGVKATSSSNLPGYAIHKLAHINDGQYGNGRSWISNEMGGGWVQLELPETIEISRIEWARDRQGVYGDRVATAYSITFAVEPGEWTRVAGSEDRLAPGNAAATRPKYRFEGLDRKAAARGQRLLAALRAAESRRSRMLTSTKAYIGTFRQPGATHRLYRGEPSAKREEVTPDTISVLGALRLQRTAPEQDRRVAFAKWATRPDNPLTSRVAVNRIWQHVFGVGIVDTPSDFGASGTRPTHPGLLDWLASELVRSGWSLKHVTRLILRSSAFRQSSRPRASAMEIDADARYVWRFPSRRLEAEAIRDGMLRASGALDLTMGGPGFSAFEVQMENVRHYFPKKRYGPADWRRMVYMTKVRQEQDSVFGAFDCPDASQVMPKRSRSTTPLQALNLFNSSFSLQQSRLFAARLEKEAGAERSRQVALAFRLAFGRRPARDELADSVAFIEAQGLDEFCRALFNANECVFIP